MEFFGGIIFILVVSYLLSMLFSNFLKIPSVVSLILVGIILGLEPVKVLLFGYDENLISILGNIGLFMLMFLAGLESSWKKLISEETDAIFIAFFGLIVPLLLGFVFGYFVLDLGVVSSFVIGICMSITAEATKTKVLIDVHKLNTRVGSAMIGAGILDDMLGLILFTGFLFFLGGEIEYTEHLMLLGVLFSFALGLVVQKFARQHHLTKKFEFFSVNFLVPFFFVNMGIHFNIFDLKVSYLLVIGLIVIAILGKMGGTFAAKKFVSFDNKQLFLIGWGMNSRGAIELALALMALQLGFISTTIYSCLVFMTIVTTSIFPFVISYLIKKYPKIMA